MIGQAISHYKILEKLGGGSMGVVYKAEDIKLKRPVALKFLPVDLTRDEEAKERFVHEAQAASALDHPNICNIHEIDETEDGQLFICMAYYEGETLKKKVASIQLSVTSATVWPNCTSKRAWSQKQWRVTNIFSTFGRTPIRTGRS
jgi:serine/threonine protein kinase